jgi:phosphoglycerate dehydrogenase-like enzyme
MNGRRILVWTGGDDRWLLAAIAAQPGVVAVPAADREQALAALASVDAFVTNVARWDADFSAALARAVPRLRWLQILNAGFDILEQCGVPPGVAVTTVGPVNASVVAEHAVFLLLELLRRGPVVHEAQRQHEWAQHSLAPALGTLRGKRVAVLGAGHIGRAVAALALAFGADVTAVARSARVTVAGLRVEALESLPAVLAAADALVVAVPLTAATQQVIDSRVLAAAKRGLLVVNVSRGRLVDTAALLASLDAGVVAGAALDVTDPEPLPRDHELWARANVIVTPHVAGMGGGEIVRAELEALVVDNVRRFVASQALRHAAALQRPAPGAMG